jgi:hypothetical protein
MNNVRREIVEVEEQNVPQLQVVVAPQNGAVNAAAHPATLKLPFRVLARPKPQLAVLDWAMRAARLAGAK